MLAQVQHKKGCVRVSGEMTVHGAAALKEELLAAFVRHPRADRLDLSDVSEFDTAGLQLLLTARRQVAGDGRDLRLVAPSNVVRETLILCHLTALLPSPAAEGTP
jgi:anti-sigma B factor antagonist